MCVARWSHVEELLNVEVYGAWLIPIFLSLYEPFPILMLFLTFTVCKHDKRRLELLTK